MDGTRADRLHAVIAKLAPQTAQRHAETGTWPVRQFTDGRRPEAAAPYVIETLPDGRRRVRVSSEDGDIVSGVGATLHDAIAALEVKVA